MRCKCLYTFARNSIDSSALSIIYWNTHILSLSLPTHTISHGEFSKSLFSFTPGNSVNLFKYIYYRTNVKNSCVVLFVFVLSVFVFFLLLIVVWLAHYYILSFYQCLFVGVDSLISNLFEREMAYKFVIYGELRLFQFHMATAEVKVFETKEHWMFKYQPCLLHHIIKHCKWREFIQRMINFSTTTQ